MFGFCKFFIFNTKGSLSNISIDELQKHNKHDDAWVVIDKKVYNITKYMDTHPGGKQILFQYIGTDITNVFHKTHELYMLGNIKKYLVGTLYQL
jgi:cytochrome-b5 reductase